MSSQIPFADARTLLLAANIIPASRIHWTNEPFEEPSPPATWLSVDAYSPNIDMLDVGARVYRETGSIRVLCLAPVGTGSDAARTLAKQVCDVYRTAPSPRNPYYLSASISDTSSDDGLWYALVVTIDFVYEDAS
jgi:hypothetical protein